MPFAYIASNDNGVVVCEFDNTTGKLDIVQTYPDVQGCHFVVRHPSLPVLYASGAKDSVSQLYAFALENGRISLLNSQPAGGVSPCYIAVDSENQCVLMVNYTSKEGRGSAVVFPIRANGQLQPRSDFVQYEGSSVNPSRQKESHPHMIRPTPDNRYVLVSDLGTDKVMVSTLQDGKLVLHSPDAIPLVAGAGPRHFAFHPDKPYMYVINELNSTLNAFQYDADKGIWYDITTVSTLPENVELDTENYPADLHMHPSGQFLYGTNRGHNSICIFKIDSETGKPELIGTQSTLGDWCRGMALDPTGEMLVVGNQRSASVLSMRINTLTGLLTPTGHRVEIPASVCIQIVD
jgi:6-phosphogluconolactonase